MVCPHRPSLAAALLALATASPAPVRAAGEAGPPAPARLETLNGVVRAVDLAAHALTVQGEGGSFTVSLDRNTLVYLPTGLASVADLRPGARVRVARDGARASWVEVREQPGDRDAGERGPASRPPQGTGPGGEAPPPAGAPEPPSALARPHPRSAGA